MSYTAPLVVASGINFATWQSDGASGHLEALITAQGPTAAPTVAATLSETGSGGTLPAATYYCVVTESNGFGETTAGPVSTGQAITLGQDLVCTYQSLKSGNWSRNLYVGTSSTGPWTLAASGVTASTTTISAPLPSNSYAVNPPTVNTTGLTYVDANGMTHNRRLELLRAVKDGRFDEVYQFLRQVIYDFNHGNPMSFSGTISRFRDAHCVFAILSTLCTEAGTLVDANAGTLGTSTNGIGNVTNRRTWP